VRAGLLLNYRASLICLPAGLPGCLVHRMRFKTSKLSVPKLCCSQSCHHDTIVVVARRQCWPRRPPHLSFGGSNIHDSMQNQRT